MFLEECMRSSQEPLVEIASEMARPQRWPHSYPQRQSSSQSLHPPPSNNTSEGSHFYTHIPSPTTSLPNSMPYSIDYPSGCRMTSHSIDERLG
jgi:hypothetical protein